MPPCAHVQVTDFPIYLEFYALSASAPKAGCALIHNTTNIQAAIEGNEPGKIVTMHPFYSP